MEKKNVKLAKKLVKLAKELVGNIGSHTGPDDLIRAIGQYPDTPEGNQALNKLIVDTFNAQSKKINGVITGIEEFRTRQLERAAALKAQYEQEIMSGKKTLDDFIQSPAYSTLRNALLFYGNPNQYLVPIVEGEGNHELQKVITFAEGPNALDAQGHLDIVPLDEPVSANLWKLSLPEAMVRMTSISGEIDLWVSRQARVLKEEDFFHKYTNISNTGLNEAGNHIHVYATKQKAARALADKLNKIEALLNKLLEGKKRLENDYNSMCNSIVGAFTNINNQVQWYATTISADRLGILTEYPKLVAEFNAKIEKMKESKYRGKTFKEFSRDEELVMQDILNRNKGEAGQGNPDFDLDTGLPTGNKQSSANQPRTMEAGVLDDAKQWIKSTWDSFKGYAIKAYNSLARKVKALLGADQKIANSVNAEADKLEAALKDETPEATFVECISLLGELDQIIAEIKTA